MAQIYAYEGSRDREDVARLRDSIYKMLQHRHGHLTGTQILSALQEISEDVHRAGMDQAWEDADIHDLENVADAWDLIWLSALAIRLHKIK